MQAGINTGNTTRRSDNLPLIDIQHIGIDMNIGVMLCQIISIAPVRSRTFPSLLSRYPAETLFVVYCAGQHCNGVHRAAIKLSQLGFAVKEMIGGVTGWRDERLPLNYAKNSSVDQSNDAVSCGCHS